MSRKETQKINPEMIDPTYECFRCKKRCVDKYPFLNEFNKRIFCDDCVKILDEHAKKMKERKK